MSTAFAPGRINLIGEHTDYNGGLAMPFAITAGVTVRARRSSDPTGVSAAALDLSESDLFDVCEPEPASGWRAFVRGIVSGLQLAGYQLVGTELTISGDLPRGCGLSSSAAMTVALSLALLDVAGVEAPDPIALARICSQVEGDWVGAQTGLLDQLASLCSEAGSALLIDFRSLEIRLVPLNLAEHQLVTLDSGERHSHSQSGYNTRRQECQEACRLLGVASLREADSESAVALPTPLDRRALHIVSENARVLDAVRALEATDMRRLGAILNASHASLRDGYEISTDAVERTVDRALRAGAMGARIVGGGFGGSVLALFAPGARIPEDARALTSGPGAHLV